MLAMGAELGHSQHGNNNAYAQDNATTWIDWTKADDSLIAFAGRLAKIRRAHPALSRATWLDAAPVGEGGPLDVEWRDADGPLTASLAMGGARAATHCLAALATRANGLDRPRHRRAQSPAPTRCRCACPTRAPTGRGASFSTRATTTSSTSRRRSPTVCASPARATLALVRSRRADAEAARAGGARGRLARRSRRHRRRLVGRRAANARSFPRVTKLALLEAMRLPAATQAQVREILAKLVGETERAPPAADATSAATTRCAWCRCAPIRPSRQDRSTRRSSPRATRTIGFHARTGETGRIALADGRTILERWMTLPDLPMAATG